MVSSDHVFMKPQKKSRSKETGTPVMVRLQADLLAKLDQFRRKEADLPGRPEAIRRLVEKAFKED